MRLRTARLIGCWLLLGVVAGCARGGDTADRQESGVDGTSVVDVGCPVLESSSTCPEVPLRARIVVFRPGSTQPVATVETGADGRFRFTLPPGEYELRGENLTGAPVPTALPVAATVVAGEFIRVTVQFDSGVRGPSGG